MRGRTRKLAYQNVSDLCAAVRELSFESHRFQESLTSIVQSACGIDEEKGLLEVRTAEYLAVSPIEWAKEMDQLYSLLGPKSFLMAKITDCANNQMPIQVTYLPKCVLDQFPKSGSYESRLIVGLRRQATGNFSVRTWQWMWISVIRSFMGLQLEEKRTLQEQTTEDDFFYNLTRNFYLGLFHKSLTSLGRELKARLVNLIHIYLIEELLFKFRKRDAKSQEVKYRLKSHYFYLLYLLILTQELQEETVKVYYQFLEKIAQNYSSTTVLTHNQNIRNMIRVWITLATRSVTVQTVLIDKLALANDAQGWFRLGRCPIGKFQESLEKLVIGSRELGRANAAKEGIIRLLDKFNEWQPSYSMLATIEQLLVFQEKRFNIDYRKDQEQQGSILVRALQRIFPALLQESNSKETITPHYQRINKRIEELYQRGLAVNLNIQPIDRSSTQAVSRSERGRLIGHLPRNMNVWEYPLQHNEFALLFKLSHWLASQIDHFLPGKPTPQPRLNIRILANPLIFFSLLILLSLLLRLL